LGYIKNKDKNTNKLTIQMGMGIKCPKSGNVTKIM
jgi:hypothetical protein